MRGLDIVTRNPHMSSVAEPLYGDFDGIASRYTESEAWVLHDDWVRLNSASVNNAVRELTKEQFDQFFPDVPPLPSTAFRSDDGHGDRRRDQLGNDSDVTKLKPSEPRYGTFDGIPSRSNEREAWVLHRAGWVEINHAEHNDAARELTKEEFDQLFPNLPPLPSTAFRRGKTVTMCAELAKEHGDFDKVARDEELKLHTGRAPLADPRGDPKSEAARLDQGDNVTLIERGNTVAYLAARRKRDNPDIAEQLAAGIVREPSVVRSEFVKRRDKELLAELTPWERELVQQAMDNHPSVTLAETIAMLKAAGM
jgi:hypothetical protein